VRTIAIINQKGGCGKTTTAINLAGVFAAHGYRTLLVDMDPQSHCAAGLAIPEQRIDVQIGDAIAAAGTGRAIDLDRLLWRVSRNLDLAPSTMRLAALEAARGEVNGSGSAGTGGAGRLAKVLASLGDRHDICLIDCSPAIGLLAFNAMVAADEVLVPVETGFFSLQGATKQANLLRSLGKKLGVAPVYRMLGTLHNPESVLAQELFEELRRRFPSKVMATPIRYDHRLREAGSFGQPVIEYAPESTGAADYQGVAEWLLANQPAPSSRRSQAEPDGGALAEVAAELPGTEPAEGSAEGVVVMVGVENAAMAGSV
jgi:chromosome partitioning protein